VIRGTTTQFKFIIPCNFSELDIVSITFWQEEYYGISEERKLPIVKVKEQCTTLNSPRELCVTLNQEETLRFTEDRKAYVQFRANALDGTSYGMKKREITVYPVRDDSILDENITPTPDYDGLVILDGYEIG
jgi:hypothetical protein